MKSRSCRCRLYFVFVHVICMLHVIHCHCYVVCQPPLFIWSWSLGRFLLQLKHSCIQVWGSTPLELLVLLDVHLLLWDPLILVPRFLLPPLFALLLLLILLFSLLLLLRFLLSSLPLFGLVYCSCFLLTLFLTHHCQHFTLL